MKLVHFFVGALTLAAGASHAADTKETMTEFETMALRLTAATAMGGEAGVAVQGVLAALEKQPATPAREESHDALGWRMGYADARAGVYHDHTPAKSGDAKSSDFHRGYEEGWAAGSSDTGY